MVFVGKSTTRKNDVIKENCSYYVPQSARCRLFDMLQESSIMVAQDSPVHLASKEMPSSHARHFDEETIAT